VAGLYKIAVANNYMFDSVRFDQQRFNWTLKEFDRYSSAFAFGLVESGFQQGDKLMIWVDSNNSAEILTAIMGASKAGVTVVTFNEKDSADSFSNALRESGAKGLIFSPKTEAESKSRLDILQSLMPELNNLYPGDEIKVKAFPQLKQIIQTAHSNIRGVIKFKDSLVYANTSMTGFSLPRNDASTSLFECYRGGRQVSSFSNGDIAEKSTQLWLNHFA
jgi:acyl-CoA synthetase (AMP-forming)/AMP-acid ligase II